MAQTFLKGKFGKRIYFGFSKFVNFRNIEKTKNALKIIPIDRILIESDLDDCFSYDIHQTLIDINHLISDVKKCSFDECLSTLLRNSKTFFNLSDDGNNNNNNNNDNNINSTNNNNNDNINNNIGNNIIDNNEENKIKINNNNNNNNNNN